MAKTTRRALASAIVLGLAVLPWLPAQGATPKTKRVSVRSNGAEADADGVVPSISGTGRFVAFESSATNFVAGDTNNDYDIFVHNRKSGKTKRVSVRSNGAQSNNESGNAAISANGRFVAFDSSATNLVSGDTNDASDIFVHNRKTGKTERVSVRSNGAQSNTGGGEAAISATGRFVAFESTATNLVGGDTNGSQDIFVHDRKLDKTRRVSIRSNGAQASTYSNDPSISPNGRLIAFNSGATNLVPGDTNAQDDIFVHNRKTGKTERVSLRSNGAQADDGNYSPSISSGRFVAFRSLATNLVGDDTNGRQDIFVHNRRTDKTKRVSLRSNGIEGNLDSVAASISADGRLVAFGSGATNLVAGDTNNQSDVFVHDRRTDKTKRVSVRSNGAQGNGKSGESSSMSSDGRFVAFHSAATNLVGGDTNALWDAFVRGPLR